ncbi:MAG: P-loop NTPase family protein [Nitrososphaerales archaeon]
MMKPLPIVVKKASELRGLTFGNKIDELLPRGLVRNSLTFLYGMNTNRTMNILCANAVKTFGGFTIFVDASNSADPYLIAKLTQRQKTRQAVKILDSIIVLRAFTCYQLYDIVTRKLDKLIKERKPNSVFVAGVSSVFNEQDNSKSEIEKLQSLMVSRLRDVADDKINGPRFVVASSNEYSEKFVSESRTVIKFSEQKAMLMKSDERRYAQVEL